MADDQRNLPLHFAAGFGRRATAEQLVALGTPVDAAGADGMTPLCAAVYQLTITLQQLRGSQGVGPGAQAQAAATTTLYLGTLRLLLACGADPGAAWGRKRVSLLVYACQGSPFGALPEVVQALLQEGADPQQADAEGVTPLSMAHLSARNFGLGTVGHQRVLALLQRAIAARQQARWACLCLAAAWPLAL